MASSGSSPSAPQPQPLEPPRSPRSVPPVPLSGPRALLRLRCACDSGICDGLWGRRPLRRPGRFRYRRCSRIRRRRYAVLGLRRRRLAIRRVLSLRGCLRDSARCAPAAYAVLRPGLRRSSCRRWVVRKACHWVRLRSDASLCTGFRSHLNSSSSLSRAGRALPGTGPSLLGQAQTWG